MISPSTGLAIFIFSPLTVLHNPFKPPDNNAPAVTIFFQFAPISEQVSHFLLTESVLRYRSNENTMYSPKIDQHTPALYRLSRLVGKPMTKVADDLILFGFKHLKAIYVDLDDVQISRILSGKEETK